MSALWYKIYDGMVDRGAATLAGINGCRAKGLLTEDEHTKLTAKWHTLNDPTPEPAPEDEEPADGAELDPAGG